MQYSWSSTLAYLMRMTDQSGDVCTLRANRRAPGTDGVVTTLAAELKKNLCGTYLVQWLHLEEISMDRNSVSTGIIFRARELNMVSLLEAEPEETVPS